MTSALSQTAMVLAAGMGMRMRPLTLAKPKPLHVVAGKTMLDRAIDQLAAFGIRRVVVNVHYLSEQIEDHLKARLDVQIILQREEKLLDTGGSVAQALPHFEGRPFFCLNADLPTLDGSEPALARMAKRWAPETMDALLLLMRTEKARGVSGDGNYFMDDLGHLRRKGTQPPRPFVMISAQILKPELFSEPPAEVFSNNIVWDRAEACGRLYGIEHDGTCFHVGTPEDFHLANKLYESGQGWGA